MDLHEFIFISPPLSLIILRSFAKSLLVFKIGGCILNRFLQFLLLMMEFSMNFGFKDANIVIFKLLKGNSMDFSKNVC